MESIAELNLSANEKFRRISLKKWLSIDCKLNIDKMLKLKGDASSRQYYRVTVRSSSYVVMDASKDLESCHRFIQIADTLRQNAISTPYIYQQDLKQGYLLLTDFGDLTFLKFLRKSSKLDSHKTALYQKAIDAVIKMQQNVFEIPDRALPKFNEAMMLKEWGWYKEWFLQKYLKYELSKVDENKLNECMQNVIQVINQQPQAFMYRDYHSANLMVVNDTARDDELESNLKLGFLDFQDAFIGPFLYDLVSMLKDCYFTLSEFEVENWLKYFYHHNPYAQSHDFAKFSKWFDFVGLQRHMKALFTFTRKFNRDGNKNYLKHLPRTINYLVDESKRYKELASLHDHILHVKSLIEKNES